MLFLAPQALSSQRHQAIGTGSPNVLPVTSSFTMILKTTSGLQVVQKVKNPPAKTADTDSITGLGRSPGEGKDSPLQYSCVKNPMDREAWQAQSTGTQTNGTGLGN